MRPLAAPGAVAFPLLLALLAPPARAQCPEEPPLSNYVGGGSVVCPCFIEGERAGAVLTAPPADYPIEILRVGIGWGSASGGAPQSLEAAVLVYGAGLPNPGAPIASLPGPVLTDGAINEYDLEPLPGEIVVASGAFTVALEFLNENAGDIFAPSVVHDGNGCQAGKNVVYAIPGGWFNACALGVTGDWVFFAVYRPVGCGMGVEEALLASGDALLVAPSPFTDRTSVDYVLEREGSVRLTVHDVAGRAVATLFEGARGAGHHAAAWDGRRADGSRAASGIYFVTLETGARDLTRKVVLSR
jgi:hypothetical protein